MRTYTITFAHDAGSPGTMVRKLVDDKAAVDYTREFVRSGYRDMTEAKVTLADGRAYNCRNVRGGVDACYDAPMEPVEYPTDIAA